MATSLSEHHHEQAQTPTVTVVFLVYNRREELRTSLHKMLVESDYDAYRVDVVVVDNASRDGSSEWWPRSTRRCACCDARRTPE